MLRTNDKNDPGVVDAMETSPVTRDFRDASPEVPSSVEQRARALQSALFYAAQQDPDQYARLLRIQRQTGIPPVVSKGRENEIEQAIEARRLDAHRLTMVSPRIAAWASDPDKAAVSGVDEIVRLARIEQNAAVMRAAAIRAAGTQAHAPTALAQQAPAGLPETLGVSAARSYSMTATNPETQHQIGTNDGGRSWFDAQTGEKVQ